MELNSCLYEVDIMHCRVRPKRHKFTHRVFMWYLDLDELDEIPKKITAFGHNRKNFYSFYDSDHISFKGPRVKENIMDYLKTKGIDLSGGKVMLLTNVRTFGHIFNPVSFYFCFDKEGRPLCVIPEIGNTFREMKPFILGPDKLEKGRFHDTQTKYFYISPFLDLDLPMEFRVGIPNHKLNIFIDDYKDNEKILYTSMTGRHVRLTNRNLWWYTLKFPFITLKVIFLIHMHAAILHFVKKIPYHNKEDNPHMQKEVYRAWSKN